MPDERAPLELYDIEEAVQKLRHVLGDRSFEEIEKEFVLKAAAERFVEIISEASRRIRPDWKAEHPEVPWSKVASIGNVLRHEYRYVKVIPNLRGIDLEALETAVAHLMRKYDPEGVALRERLRASGELPLPPSTPKAD
ncbi:MAG TPA: HepT-like ribonuclease domain-containing protein [Beijerinckiaceae bacterium]|jgi:uncharacterized protein with HEPN domain|nr:HepT-like ribonuclease domain-containing protein [Beijerinckiaceae bacterium]